MGLTSLRQENSDLFEKTRGLEWEHELPRISVSCRGTGVEVQPSGSSSYLS